MDDFSVFKHVLHIGPNYRNHKGGMGAVIDVYQKNIPNFNFVASYEGNYSSFKNLSYFLSAFFKIIWVLIKNRKIQILHIHSAAFGSFYRKYLIFLLGKFIFKKKIVFHLHAGDFKIFFDKSGFFTKKNIEFFINNSECVIVLSKVWMKFIKSHFKPKQVIILNNPIEIPSFVQDNDLVGNNLTNLLFLGSITEDKGIFNLIRVLNENHTFYRNNLRLRIGGSGEVGKLKTFINDNLLQDIIEYVGWVDGSLKNHFLCICDVLVLPSYFEGLPIAILEAMSYGKAVIATNVGGIPEVVRDGINGFLIDPGDNEALKQKIDFVLANRSCLSKMGRKSREAICDYDIFEVIKHMRNLYANLM